MRLELSRRAQADLDDIRDYGAERFGVDRTIAYLDALENVLRRLLSFPELGVDRFDLGAGRRSIPAGTHRIYYALHGDRILVERVLHKRMEERKAREIERLRAAWHEGLASGPAVDGNFDVEDIVRRGRARLEAERDAE